jgi:hypothetical protein
MNYTPGLKANIMRDRNFNTPYFTNPYGYAKNAFDRSKVNQIEGRKGPARMSTDAFNPDTRKIFSPLDDDSPSKAPRSPEKVGINKKLLSSARTANHNSVWANKEKASLLQMKTSYGQNMNSINGAKTINNPSNDIGSVRSLSFNKTYSSGFNSTMNSTGFKGDETSNILRKSMYNTRGVSQNYGRRYAKYKHNNTAVHDKSGGDALSINKIGIHNKTPGREQNFKINYTNYGNEFDGARPVPHSKSKKYCSMTRFVKSLHAN